MNLLLDSFLGTLLLQFPSLVKHSRMREKTWFAMIPSKQKHRGNRFTQKLVPLLHRSIIFCGMIYISLIYMFLSKPLCYKYCCMKSISLFENAVISGVVYGYSVTMNSNLMWQNRKRKILWEIYLESNLIILKIMPVYAPRPANLALCGICTSLKYLSD